MVTMRINTVTKPCFLLQTQGHLYCCIWSHITVIYSHSTVLCDHILIFLGHMKLLNMVTITAGASDKVLMQTSMLYKFSQHSICNHSMAVYDHIVLLYMVKFTVLYFNTAQLNIVTQQCCMYSHSTAVYGHSTAVYCHIPLLICSHSIDVHGH